MTAEKAIAVVELVRGKKAGADGFVRIDVDTRTWRGLAVGCARAHQHLSGLWYDAGRIRMAMLDEAHKLRVIASLPTRKGAYPSVGLHHAPAIRLERAIADLRGIVAEGLTDTRSWLDHGAWPSKPPGYPKAMQSKSGAYAFLPVEGESLHQIPVGPVHAGIIEPGHFRFTANGEAVVRLEERLGYVHKGIEALCQGADIERAARLAARISGDSTVAYSFGFCHAIEAALGWKVPPRSAILRGVMAELERLANHINDVGAICNDASVVVLHARCTLLREKILQTANNGFGHRLMMDRIVPGGVAVDLADHGRTSIENLLKHCSEQFERVMHVYEESPSLQDRTVTTGVVKPELVQRFAAGGFVGRASGRSFDTRTAFAYAPYDQLEFKVTTRGEGDVDARLSVRAEEVRSSIAIIRQLLNRLEAGSIRGKTPRLKEAEGAALVEGFRGDILVSVRLDGKGRITHFHARDPSWFQWPLLEAAIEGNIVADFPLCNKSFNCSYSGHDM